MDRTDNDPEERSICAECECSIPNSLARLCEECKRAYREDERNDDERERERWPKEQSNTGEEK